MANQTNASKVTIGDEYHHREVDIFYHDVLVDEQHIGVLFRHSGENVWGFDLDADETRFDDSELGRLPAGQTPWGTPEEARGEIGRLVQQALAPPAQPAPAEEAAPTM